jgi:opacity protein-like surface antigen
MVPSGAVSLGSPTTCIAPYARVSTSADSTWLFYGKARGGWVGSDNHTITNTVTGASIGGFSNNTNSGWLVGAGIEWALASNWSVKIEYDYLGLNSQTFTAPVETSPLATLSACAETAQHRPLARSGSAVVTPQ